jgi:DNA-binding transcriptional MerR regulator
MVKGEWVLIGELSEKTGLSIHALRYYERVGLLGNKAVMRARNNYRDYDPGAVETLRVVKCAQGAGFSLKEIAVFMKDWASDKSLGGRRSLILRKKLEEVDAKIREIQAIRAIIIAKLGGT